MNGFTSRPLQLASFTTRLEARMEQSSKRSGFSGSCKNWFGIFRARIICFDSLELNFESGRPHSTGTATKLMTSKWTKRRSGVMAGNAVSDSNGIFYKLLQSCYRTNAISLEVNDVIFAQSSHEPDAL